MPKNCVRLVPGYLSTFLSLSLSSGYIYHPKTEEAEYLENYHLVNSDLGIKLGFAFSSLIPISLGLLISGGITVSIMERFDNTETNYLINPNMCIQFDFQYNFKEMLVFIVKGQYLAVIGGGSLDDWYQESSVGAGIGFRL